MLRDLGFGDFGRRHADIAVDLGSTNTRIGARGRGLLVELPSVVAMERKGQTRTVVAVGDGAREMLGRTPDRIQARRPVRGSVIEDYGLVQDLLDHAIRLAFGGRVPSRARVAISLGQGTQEVARRAVQDAARAIGVREVVLIPKGVAAAVGSELPVQATEGNLLVDLGGGTTEVVLMSMGGLIDHEVVDVGGTTIDSAIAGWVREVAGISIGERAAETLKLQAAQAAASQGGTVVVTGRDQATGIPKEVRLEAEALTKAVLPTLQPVVEGLRAVLSRSSPELAADIADNGLVLCGGVALLPGVVAMVRDATGLPVVLSETPQHATVHGTLKLLDDSEALARVAWR